MASRIYLHSPDSYAVAWIAALAIERAAAEAMLDEEHAAPSGFARHQTDSNVYTWGRVGEHNVVIASLAAGVYGATSAATTASSLLASLPSIRISLSVGIGGGIARPDDARDIRLGDIVVSQPDGTTGGVCQYDLIKAKSGDRRERKGFLGRPPTVLLNALASIQADHERKDSKIPCFLQQMLEKNPKMGRRSKQSPGFIHQGFDNDRLFKASSGHVIGPDCRDCDAASEVQRNPRETTDPDVHYGTIASGNTLVKDAAARDRIIADIGDDCICFEIEAAGLTNHFPCLVIRGICDYADSHKNDRWQRYASATAAAYAKELLAYVPAAEVQETKRALEVLNQELDSVQQTTVAAKVATVSIQTDLRTEKIERWLRPSDPFHHRTNDHDAESLEEASSPGDGSISSKSPSALWSDREDSAGRSTDPSLLPYEAAVGQAANPRSYLTFFNHKRPRSEHDPEMSDDIQSVRSMDDDIGSLVESNSGMAGYQQAAVGYLATVFTGNSDLLDLYEKGAQSMDDAKFVRNHRRLLKKFFLDLRSEAEYNPSQKLAVQFLRSRSRRTSISVAIRDIVTPSDNTVREKMKILMNQDRDSLGMLERFLRDSEGSTNANKPDVQVEGSASEDSEDSEDDADIALLQLEKTAEFLTSGRPFQRYIENLRGFLYPAAQAGDLRDSLEPDIQAQRTAEDKPLDFDYDYSFTMGRCSALETACKRGVERIAGCPLSWWPLSEPEEELESGYTRVYSAPSTSSHDRDWRFYDDIPTELAETLFPTLAAARAFALPSSWAAPRREAIFIRRMTLLRLILRHRLGARGWGRWDGGTTPEQGEGVGQGRRDAQTPDQRAGGERRNTSEGGAPSLVHGASGERMDPENAEEQVEEQVEEEGSGDGEKDKRILFLSVDIMSNNSVACPVGLGYDDKSTLKNLRATYQGLPGRTWMRATGIKFYRFQSFHFQQSLKRRYVDIHKDKQRYPEQGDPEYVNYIYSPCPWEEGDPIPCPPREAWYFFQNPDECGSFKGLNDTLPVRLKDALGFRVKAWGIYIERRYSILPIIIPAIFLALVALGGTLWLIPWWLNKHPNDLQNATIPVVVFFTVAGFFLQLFVSLLIFRWSL